MATIAVMILAVMWGFAWAHLAGRPRLGARGKTGDAHVSVPDRIIAHEQQASASNPVPVRPQLELAAASPPKAAPGPVRGKLVLFPSRSNGQASVLATAQGSRSLYVYWDRTRVGDEHLRSIIGEDDWLRTTPCLRVFDITASGFPAEPGGRALVISLPERADHQIIAEGIVPGHRYVVSYERRTVDGQHYLLSQSAPVSLPPDSPPAGRSLHRLHARRPGKWSGSP